MANIIKRIWNQNKMVNIEALQGMAFQAEDGGHTFEISGVDDEGNAVPLSGTVAGAFMRPDKADIALVGTASDGVVSVTLSDACYAVTGKFGLTIFVTDGNNKKTAVYAAVGTVVSTTGGAVAGDTPQDVVDLINAIEAAVATIPASYSGLMADIAPTYSSLAVYPVGAYVYYNGDLYRCTTSITTGESWTAAHWTATDTGSDIANLKNSLYNDNVFNIADWENGAIDVSNGNPVSSSSRIRYKGFLPWTITYIGRTGSSGGFLLYAWDKNGNYVGGWKNGEFTNDVTGYSSIDLSQLYKNPAYSGYQYKIVAYNGQVDTINWITMKNLPLEKLFVSSPILTHSHVILPPNGTDFDTLVSAGNYYIENYSHIASCTNTPPVATGGRLLVYYDVSPSRPVQMWVSFNSQDEPEIWIRKYTTAWKKWCKVGGHAQPTNIRVLGYNIGAFNWGADGGLSENVAEKIANYKRFFGETNPDIMLFAEMSTNIDSSGVYPSDATLLSPLFATRTNFHQNAADTNLANAEKVENDGGVYLRNNNNEYAGAVGRLVCDIGNKKLLMSGGFLRVLSTAQDRLEAFQNYLTAVSGYDYSIIYLDTNVQDDTERQSIYDAATSAGYQVCNGGYFGLHNTLVPTSMYKPIDNVFVKGNIKVKNFYAASDVYDELSSDHIPIVADLTLY